MDHDDFRHSKKRREDSESVEIPAMSIVHESDRLSFSIDNSIVPLSQVETESKKEIMQSTNDQDIGEDKVQFANFLIENKSFTNRDDTV